MRKSVLLFDIDGTLVDSNPLHVLAWDEAFRDAGFHLPREALHQQIGKGADNYVPALLPELSRDEQEKLGEAHGRIYTGKYIDQVRPFPGARELLLRSRDSGRTVVLASSASQEELEHYLDLLDARAIVATTTSKDDVAHSKPCPDIFAAARDKAGAAPDEALVIGDTPYDIEAARRSGLEAVAVRSGGFSDQDLGEAIAIYDDVATLNRLFESTPLGA